MERHEEPGVPQFGKIPTFYQVVTICKTYAVFFTMKKKNIVMYCNVLSYNTTPPPPPPQLSIHITKSPLNDGTYNLMGVRQIFLRDIREKPKAQKRLVSTVYLKQQSLFGRFRLTKPHHNLKLSHVEHTNCKQQG